MPDVPEMPDIAADRSATMREVASLAKVGIATVSRVVNGKPGVAPDLVERVTRAAQMLGYRHDFTASSLRRADRRTGTVGLILEDAANPFSSALHRSVEDAAAERGVLVLASSSDGDPDRERGILQTFAARRVDGLIVVPTGQANDELAAARRRKVPVVCLDRPVEFDRVDTVTVDNRTGARTAVRVLHAAGHRRIAFLGDLRTIWTARERHDGFVEALAQVGCPLDDSLVRRDLRSATAAEQAALELLALPEPPTAIFSAQNLITIGTRRALQHLGMHHRVALIGFDDVSLADLLEPGISVIAQDPAALGREGARLFFERLDGEQGPARHSVIPAHYLARGSGELPAPSGSAWPPHG